MSKNFLDIFECSAENLKYILDLSLDIKKNPQKYSQKLSGKKMILLLEKNSTRTRISFEFAIKELGGMSCILNADNTQISRGESIEDTAKLFDRYTDFVVFRTHAHDRLLSLAKNCQKASVINALTDRSHPCQIMADIMTIIEQQGQIEGKKITWFGDVNNILQSWIEASEKLNFSINVCCPGILKNLIPYGKNVQFIEDKFAAVENCDVVTTDTWVSMGQEKDKVKIFENLTVDVKLMNFAKKDAIFLHCLPAYCGYEVANDIMDDEKYSKIIFDEAENRLHVQKAIMVFCNS